MIAIVTMPVFASNPSAYISLYKVDTTCESCISDPTDYDYSIASGLNVGYVGAEVIISNGDMGGSLYLQIKPISDLRLYIGISDIPDSANITVPTYGTFSDSNNASAHMIGADYKMLSIRYYIYDTSHSIIKSTYDPVDKTHTNIQTGNVSLKKHSVWIGITHTF